MYEKRRKKKALQLKTQTVPYNSSTKKFTTANTPKLHRAAWLYTSLRQWGERGEFGGASASIGDVANSKRPLLIIPKVQLSLRVTRKSWQK